MAALDALPTELVEEIGNLLPLDEFRALRFTCKTLRSDLLPTFEKRFFKTATVHLVETDLVKLLALSRSQFAKLVQELVVEFEEDNIVANLKDHGFAVENEMSAVPLPGIFTTFPRKERGCGRTIVLSSSSMIQFDAYLGEKRTTLANGRHKQLLRPALAKLVGLKMVRFTDLGRTHFPGDLYAFLDMKTPRWIMAADDRSRTNADYGPSLPADHPICIVGPIAKQAGVAIYVEFGGKSRIFRFRQ